MFKRHQEKVTAFKNKEVEGQETKFDFYMIDVDLPRTFPELNSLFEQSESLAGSLREILVAWDCFRPDIGYI